MKYFYYEYKSGVPGMFYGSGMIKAKNALEAHISTVEEILERNKGENFSFTKFELIDRDSIFVLLWSWLLGLFAK